MKKIDIVRCLATLIFVASCAAPELEPTVDNPNVEQKKPAQKITINVEETPSGYTKAIHGTEESETSFTWQAGVDQIGVIKDIVESWDGETWDYWDMDHHRFTNTKDGSIATFAYDPVTDGEGLVWGEPLELNVGDKIVAYYPFNTAASSWYDSSKPYLMSSLGSLVQRGDNTTEHLFRGDYMYSKVITLTPEHFDAENNVNLTIQFGHIFSKVRFSVKNTTSETLDISSLIYRSTKEDDVMQGTLVMDASTGELSAEGLGDWGMVPPSNSSVLEVEGVSIAPGETATLWMWLMPHDFTEGNPDGRTADIMINTNKGVFRVADKTFDAKFEPGKVYRHGLVLSEEKLLADYAYISDPNFARILYAGVSEEYYDEEKEEWIWKEGSHVTLYDMTLQPIEFDPEYFFDLEVPFSGGCFIKLSEAVNVEDIVISAGEYNALSLDGLQYFTGLRSLFIALGSDMNSNLTMRTLKIGSLVNLEELNIENSMQIYDLDVTNNTKLRALHLRTPRLEKIIGLEDLSKLESFSLNAHNLDEETVLDLRNCENMHSLDVPLNVKVNISGLNLQLLRVDDATKLISDDLSCKVLENYLGYPFPSGAPDGVESLLVYFNQGDGQPSMFGQFADMTDLTDVDMTFYCSGVDYKFTSAQSSIKKLEMMQVDEPQTEIPVPTGWNYLTGVDTLYINKDVNHYDSFWNFTASAPLDLSGMSSLNHAEIRVNKLGGFAVPASLKSLELGARSSINFTPTGLEYLNLSAGDNPIVIGDAPLLQEIVLYGSATADTDVITLGACPNLEEFRINVERGKLNFKASSYPALKVFSVQQGRDVKTIPSSSVLPALQDLRISESGYGAREIGIGGLDLTGYKNLNKFYIGGLDQGYAYRNYTNRYYTGSSYAVRPKGAFVITQEQFNAAKAYAKANVGSEFFSGIVCETYSAWDDVNEEWVECLGYKVNSVYKVVDANGDEITITDSDFSDGEVTSIVYSKTN